MITVQSVSTSAEIVVISFRSQHIINFIVKSFKAESFSKFISFGSVVEYDIKNYFDSIFVELTDQFFQFGSLTVMFCLGSIAGVWGKEVNRIVSPVFQKTLAVYGTGIHVLVELEDRHQLHRIDSQFFEVRNLFTKTGKSSRVCDTGRSVLCKSADMKFVDDQVTDLTGGLRHVFPVERIAYHTGVIASNLLLSPFALTGNGFGIRIKKNFCLIEDMAFFRFIRTVDAVAVFQVFDVQSHDDHGIDITDTTGIGKRKNCERLLFSGVEKKKLAGCTVTGMCGKVDSVGKGSSAI